MDECGVDPCAHEHLHGPGAVCVPQPPHQAAVFQSLDCLLDVLCRVSGGGDRLAGIARFSLSGNDAPLLHRAERLVHVLGQFLSRRPAAQLAGTQVRDRDAHRVERGRGVRCARPILDHDAGLRTAGRGGNLHRRRLPAPAEDVPRRDDSGHRLSAVGAPTWSPFPTWKIHNS